MLISLIVLLRGDYLVENSSYSFRQSLKLQLHFQHIITHRKDFSILFRKLLKINIIINNNNKNYLYPDAVIYKLPLTTFLPY